MINLRDNPFYLNDKSEHWVYETLETMTLDEKLGQIFIQRAQPERDYLDDKIIGHHIGGVLFRQNSGKVIQDTLRYIQKHAKIPVLFCGNLEEGGIGLAQEGTYFSKQMETAATGDPKFAYENGRVIAEEAQTLGCHMSFGPVIDMTLDWRSPITANNSYGADPDQVLTYASANMRGQMENGMATAVKHFPGEGQDDHDQHFQLEVNEMSTNEWDRCFGKIFSRLIAEKTMAIMPGHIALPSYERYFSTTAPKQPVPATFSKALLTDLLRGKLGFNGLIVSDNTCIPGASNFLPRELAVPQMVMAGIDLILYSFDVDEDIYILKAALADGRLTMARLDEAVLRNLAVKASLGLPEKQTDGTLVPSSSALNKLASSENLASARACADQAVTLVKDTQSLLPLTLKKQRKVLLTVIADAWEQRHMKDFISEKLIKRGFDVTIFDPQAPEPVDSSIFALKKRYDLFLYVARQESAHKEKLSLRVNWERAGNLPRFTADIPAVYVSLGSPFDLYDVSMMKTYINAYCGTDIVIDEVLKKLVGESEFKGVSPVDPFCGKDYLKY